MATLFSTDSTKVDETQDLVDFDDSADEKKSKKRPPVLFMVLAGALLCSVLLNFYFNNRAAKFKNKDLDQISQLKTEKLALEEQIALLNSKVLERDKSLEDAYQNMEDKDNLITHLNKENETLREIKQEVQKLNAISKNLSSQSAVLSASRKKLLEVQNKVNKTIDDKTRANQKLSEGLK